MLTRLQPDLSLFWPRSQDQYLLQWNYAYQKYRSGLGAGVALVGPSTSSQPSLSNQWWSTYASNISSTKNVRN